MLVEVWWCWVVVARVGEGPRGLRVMPLADMPLRAVGAEGTRYPVAFVGAEGELGLVIELFWSGLVALR